MIAACRSPQAFNPAFKLADTDTVFFNNFVDCNMAEAWVGDTFRIFPGKYGEDALWGHALDLTVASGHKHDVAFKSDLAVYTCPAAPSFDGKSSQHVTYCRTGWVEE
jgi:hypothetical protein